MVYLFKYLKARWDGSSGATVRALATGGIHAQQAPIETGVNTGQQDKKPYVVLSIISDDCDGTMSDNQDYGTAVLQFSVFVSGDYQLDLAWSVAQALKLCYDNCGGTFADSKGVLKAIRRMGMGRPIKDPDGGWQIVIEYKAVYTHVNT